MDVNHDLCAMVGLLSKISNFFFGGGKQKNSTEMGPLSVPSLALILLSAAQFSKETLEFSFGSGLDDGEGSDELTITNHKAFKIKYKIEPAPSPQCAILANPATGSIAPGKEKKIKLKADLKEKINLNFKLTVVLGTEAHFLTVRIRSVSGVFGTDPSTLDHVEDEGLRVPEVLVQMKRSLIAAGGLKSEGLFRLAGDVAEIARLKEEMNKKVFQGSDNINTVATLIKVWFRELPEPLFDKVPTESIFYSSDADRCIAAYNGLPEPSKTLLTWLLDLLCKTTEHAQINRMTPQNLAIVVAPNLYDTSSSDPMEGLVMSQKCVQFLNNILLWYLEQKTGSVPQHISSPPIQLKKDNGESSTGSLIITPRSNSKSPTKQRKLQRNATEGISSTSSVSRAADGGTTSPRGSPSNSPRSGVRRNKIRETSGSTSSGKSVSSPRIRPSNAPPPIPNSTSNPDLALSSPRDAIGAVGVSRTLPELGPAVGTPPGSPGPNSSGTTSGVLGDSAAHSRRPSGLAPPTPTHGRAGENSSSAPGNASIAKPAPFHSTGGGVSSAGQGEPAAQGIQGDQFSRSTPPPQTFSSTQASAAMDIPQRSGSPAAWSTGTPPPTSLLANISRADSGSLSALPPRFAQPSPSHGGPTPPYAPTPTGTPPSNAPPGTPPWGRPAAISVSSPRSNSISANRPSTATPPLNLSDTALTDTSASSGHLGIPLTSSSHVTPREDEPLERSPRGTESQFDQQQRLSDPGSPRLIDEHYEEDVVEHEPTEHATTALQPLSSLSQRPLLPPPSPGMTH